jgi:hypothetical protein
VQNCKTIAAQIVPEKIIFWEFFNQKSFFRYPLLQISTIFLKDHFHFLEIKKLFPIETDPQQINQSYYSNSNPKSLEAK